MTGRRRAGRITLRAQRDLRTAVGGHHQVDAGEQGVHVRGSKVESVDRDAELHVGGLRVEHFDGARSPGRGRRARGRHREGRALRGRRLDADPGRQGRGRRGRADDADRRMQHDDRGLAEGARVVTVHASGSAALGADGAIEDRFAHRHRVYRGDTELRIGPTGLDIVGPALALRGSHRRVQLLRGSEGRARRDAGGVQGAAKSRRPTRRERLPPARSPGLGPGRGDPPQLAGAGSGTRPRRSPRRGRRSPSSTTEESPSQGRGSSCTSATSAGAGVVDKKGLLPWSSASTRARRRRSSGQGSRSRQPRDRRQRRSPSGRGPTSSRTASTSRAWRTRGASTPMRSGPTPGTRSCAASARTSYILTAGDVILYDAVEVGTLPVEVGGENAFRATSRSSGRR